MRSGREESFLFSPICTPIITEKCCLSARQDINQWNSSCGCSKDIQPLVAFFCARRGRGERDLHGLKSIQFMACSHFCQALSLEEKVRELGTFLETEYKFFLCLWISSAGRRRSQFSVLSYSELICLQQPQWHKENSAPGGSREEGNPHIPYLPITLSLRSGLGLPPQGRVSRDLCTENIQSKSKLSGAAQNTQSHKSQGFN